MRQQNHSYDNLITKRVRSGRLRRVVAILSAFVLLTTMNTLKFDADTLERIATCGIVQHEHDESCYDAKGVLTCDKVEHVHTDACYQQRPTADNAAATRIDEYVPLNAQVNLASPIDIKDDDKKESVKPVDVEKVDEDVGEVVGELTGAAFDDEDDVDVLFTADEDEIVTVDQEQVDSVFEDESETADEDEAADDTFFTDENETVDENATDGEDEAADDLFFTDENETADENVTTDENATPAENATTDEENSRYVYDMDEQQEVLLSTILDSLDLNVEEIINVCVAKNDEAVLAVAQNEDGEYVITALDQFEKAEIAVVADDDEYISAFIIAITGAKVEEKTEVGEDETGEEASEIKVSEEKAEEVKDEEENPENDTENAEEPTEVVNDGTEENADSEEETAAEDVTAIESDNVTIVPVGDTSLSGNLEILYNENVDKRGAVDQLEAMPDNAVFDISVYDDGVSQILLSRLIERVGIIDDNDEMIRVADVQAVSFSDMELITIEEVSGETEVNGEPVDVGEKDFLITSEKPFTTGETLFITLMNGEIITVRTTDAIDITTNSATQSSADITAATTVGYNSTEQKYTADSALNTMEGIPACGIEEHTHTDACFDVEGNIVCGLLEHIHSDACYQERPKAAQEIVEPIQPPVEEWEEQELEDLDESTDGDAEETADMEARPEPEEPQGYIVGTRNPFYLSDIIADQELDISIDDVVEVGQPIESDDDPVLFHSEPVDGDIAFYVDQDFERAELAITTEDELHVVELLFGIAPIEENNADTQEAPVPSDETTPDEPGDIEQAAGDEDIPGAGTARLPEDDVINEDQSEGAQGDEAAEDAQAVDLNDEGETPKDTGDEASPEQPDETVEDAPAQTEGEPDAEPSDEEKTEGDTEEPSDEEKAEGDTEEPTDEKKAEGDAEEPSDEEKAEGDVEEPSDEEKTGEDAEEPTDEKKAEGDAEEPSDEEKAEGDAEEPSDEEKAGEDAEEPSDEEKAEDASDGEQAAEDAADGAQPQPAAVYSHYEATIDLSDAADYPIALADLMAEASFVDAGEDASPVEDASSAEDVSSVEDASSVEGEDASISEDEAAEVVEAEAAEPMPDVAGAEPEDAESADSGVPEILEPDAWIMDYDTSLLSIERDGDGYALSVIDSFDQTVVTVNNGRLYIITLLNGSAPVLFPAAAFTASTEFVTVNVEAAEGAFPAGTTMVVEDVGDEDTIHDITDKVEEAFVQVERVHAVDITFLDAEGAIIEPLIPISVVMSVREIEAEKETMVVHVDHEGEAQVVDTAEAIETVNPPDAADESTAEAGTAVAFTADSFSVYAVVVGAKLETKAIAADGNTYRIEVTYTGDAGIPAGATLQVDEVTEDETYRAQVEESLDGTIALARFFDIRIMNGEEAVQPSAPVVVRVELINEEETAPTAVPCAVHFTEDEMDVVKATEADAAVSFRAESFSVWGVVYTVDFHYEVNGETFDFSLPGGGFISLYDLVEALEIETDDEETEENEIQAFVNDVENIEFSTPELVNVSKVEEDTTVGAIKERLGLVCEYSAELTEEEIEAINAQPVQAGDWALISLMPFDTEESLTITMVNGDQFVVKVTDAQLKKTVISASGETYEITVTYGEDAQIPDGAELNVEEITEEADHQAYVTKTQEALGRETDDSRARFFDISIVDKDGNEVQPAAAVSVEIRLLDMEITEGMQVVHFGETAELMDLNRDPESLNFMTGGFSVFAVVVIESEEGSYVFHGDGFTIKITHTAEAQLPLGTILTVEEIDPESDDYIQRLGQAWYEVNREYFEVEKMRANENETVDDLPDLNLVNLDAARFFDISFEYNGEEIEPNDAVRVEINYDEGLKALGDCEAPVSGVAHYGEEAVELIGDVETETDANGGIVSFKYEQSSFSDTGTFVGQETHNDKLPSLRMAAAPVYDPAKAITLSAPGANSSSSLPAPASSKTLTPNKKNGQNDGTYTLNLSVAGSSKPINTAEVTRSNVLIVMDRSSSMVNNKVKIYNEYNGKPKSNVTYYGKEGDSYFQLYTYNNKYYTTSWTEYKGQVYTVTEGDKRLDAEQAALSSLISQLLAKNTEIEQDSQGYMINDKGERVKDKNGQDIKVNDIIEISVISFAHRALGSYPGGVNSAPPNYGSEVGWTTNYNTLMAGVNKDDAPSGTNWEDALKYAKYVAETQHDAQPDEPVFVIFLTDGEPTAVAGETNNAHHYINDRGDVISGGFEFALTEQPSTLNNNTNRDIDGKNALDRAKEIQDYEWCNFEAVYTYGDRDDQVWYLQRLVNYAYGNDDNNDISQSDTLKAAEAVKEHFFDARDTSALLNAFQSILSRISGSISVGNVSMADGLTTDATATTLVSGTADGFRYSVTGPLGELYSVTATGSDSNPTVTFTINGHTYPGVEEEVPVTRNKTDSNGIPIPDPDNPGKYQTESVIKTRYYVDIDGTKYVMALANIDGNSQITWDLSAVGTLMSGYSYNCSFVVWPEQEAYDYVAGLNNGLPSYVWDQSKATAVLDENGEVVYWTGGVTEGGPDNKGYPSIVKYPNGTFSVLTNTNQSVTYSIVDTKTDEQGHTDTTYDGPYTKPLDFPDPMDLTGSKLSITKYWDDSMDAQQLKDVVDDYAKQHPGQTYSVTLTMKENGVKYKDYTFYPVWDTAQNCYTWKSADFSIAPALLVSKHPGGSKTYKTVTIDDVTYFVLNDGHEYTLDEEVVDYHFEFSADSYHPALVDGLMYNVDFEVDENGYIVTGSTATKSERTLETFTGTNTLKGRLYVEKKTVVPEGTKGVDLSKLTFDVKITLMDKNGSPVSSVMKDGTYDAESGLMYRIHYGPYHPHGGDFNEEFGTYGRSRKYAVENGVIEEAIYSGDVIYVGNMPVGTHYEVEETSMPLGWKQVGIVAKNEDGEVDSEQIIYGNKADNVTITNTVPSFDVNILKTNEDGTHPLGGARFTLYGSDYYVTDDSGNKVVNENPTVIAPNLVSDGSTGLISLGQLGGGEYYLVEDVAPEGYLRASEPIHIVVNGNSTLTKNYVEAPETRPLYVTYTQVGNGLSSSGEGVAIEATPIMNNGEQVIDQAGNVLYNYSYTLTVTNNPGVKLPSTGGPGTTIFHGAGLGLMLLAVLGFVLRFRRRERGEGI